MVNVLAWSACIIYFYMATSKDKALRYFIYVQGFMLFDILHAVLRLVKGGVFTTLLQVSSRLYVAFIILPYQINSQEVPNIFNYCMFTAWSVAEVVRYSYYLCKNSKIVKFLRYNLFIVLYPIGVCAGELPLIYRHYRLVGY